MNCKKAQLLIAGLNGDNLPENLAAHVESCPACADLLSMDAQFRMTLRSQTAVPSAHVLDRIRTEIAAPPRRSWIELLKRNALMKITLPATALLAVAFIATLPHSADAATPLATFAKMKTAVLAKAKSMTSLDVKVGKTPNGSVGTWVLLNGELVPISPDGTFHAKKDGKDFVVSSSVSGPDLSSLSPAQRAQVKKAIADALSGHGDAHVSTKYIVHGKEVDSATAHDELLKQGIDLNVSIDLDPNDYRSISFGADHNHLVLSPSSSKDRRYVVTLDPSTSLPKTVVLERAQNGRWVAMKRSNVTL